VELLDEVARKDYRAAAVRVRAGRPPALSVVALLALDRARRNNVLRYWAAQGAFELPSFDALSRLEKEVLRARPDAAPVLAWGDTELRRFRGALHLMARLPPPPARGTALEWDGRSDLALPAGCGTLKVLKPSRLELPLRVVFARGGERLKPAGARFTRTLRNLFQEEAVPPWVRERMPLVQLDGELAAVADRWETAALQKLRARHKARWLWQHALPGV
jgi:tRNA(Ile)-lysidine synthase